MFKRFFKGHSKPEPAQKPEKKDEDKEPGFSPVQGVPQEVFDFIKKQLGDDKNFVIGKHAVAIRGEELMRRVYQSYAERYTFTLPSYSIEEIASALDACDIAGAIMMLAFNQIKNASEGGEFEPEKVIASTVDETLKIAPTLIRIPLLKDHFYKTLAGAVANISSHCFSHIVLGKEGPWDGDLECVFQDARRAILMGGENEDYVKEALLIHFQNIHGYAMMGAFLDDSYKSFMDRFPKEISSLYQDALTVADEPAREFLTDAGASAAAMPGDEASKSFMLLYSLSLAANAGGVNYGIITEAMRKIGNLPLPLEESVVLP